MRQIGTIDTESQARVFRSYLLTLGIHSDVEQSRDRHWEIWVHEENRLDEGRAELEQFLANPKDTRYQAAMATGKGIEKEEKKENKKFRDRQIDMRNQWHLNQMAGTPLTLILIMVSVAMTIFLNVPAVSPAIRQWFSIMAIFPVNGGMGYRREMFYEIYHGQVWRLITPIFLHFGIMHILFNMLWLKQLGGAVEFVEGTWKLALQVLVYAIAGNVLQCYLSGPSFGGMSGVVYGLFAYMWLVGKYEHEGRYFIDPMTVGLMLVWFFACLFHIIPHVANGAHAAGLVLGTLWATFRIRRIPFTNVRF